MCICAHNSLSKVHYRPPITARLCGRAFNNPSGEPINALRVERRPVIGLLEAGAGCDWSKRWADNVWGSSVAKVYERSSANYLPKFGQFG